MLYRRRSATSRLWYTRRVLGIGRKAWLLALASGALQALVFPSPALDWLCWVALAPLLVAVLAPPLGSPGEGPRPPRLRHGFLLGYSSGIV